MIYGYARVSSVGQARDGNSIEAQTAALLERGCEEIHSEAYTGTTTDRPELLKILGKIQKGDTLMVTKLDRFSRSAAEGVALIQALHEKGIVIEILNMGRADNTPMGEAHGDNAACVCRVRARPDYRAAVRRESRRKGAWEENRRAV